MRPRRIYAVPPKNVRDVAREWDRLAQERLSHFETGLDISFDYVVAPAVLGLVGSRSGRVLDVGCGVGALTHRLAQLGGSVVGIDPSAKSIDLAMRSNSAPSLTYVNLSVEDYAQEANGQFDTIVANMSLMSMPSLQTAVAAMGSLLRDDGTVILAITHPWFWPRYWGYSDASWFHYPDEIFIEAEFAITKARSTEISTHIHRPLERYIRSFAEAALLVSSIAEPMPTVATSKLYPSPWAYPRFLVASMTKRR